MTERPSGRARRSVRSGRQRGLTLIELMISITLGLVVVGAVSYLYIGSRGAYRGNESLAHIQEAGRFAMDSITRDIRRAGALGCGTLASVASGGAVAINAIARPANLTAVLPVDSTTSVAGFAPASYAALPTTSTWTPPAGAPAYWGGDVLQLQIGYGAPVRVIGNPDPVALTIPIADNTQGKFSAGDYAVLANCSAATIFMVTAATTTTAPAADLSFGAGAAATGGNGVLGGPTPVLAQPQTPGFAYDSHSTVQHFDQVTYYLGVVPNSTSTALPNGQPALYRYSLRTGTAEEIVENVEDLDIVYGVGAGGSMSSGTFMHAGLMGGADWGNVVSIRVSVLAVGDPGSYQTTSVTTTGPTPQTVLFRTDPTLANSSALVADAAVPADGRLRQSFTATAALRDRLQ
jgi:type IV pilus assembly protein PilW